MISASVIIIQETLNEKTGEFNPGDHDDRGGRSGVGCY